MRHHHGAFNLVSQMFRIHNCAALKRRHYAVDPHFRRRGRHFRAKKFMGTMEISAHVAT